VGRETRSKSMLWVTVLLLTVSVSPALSFHEQATSAPTATASLLDQTAEELRPRYGPVRFHREEELEERFVVIGSPLSVLSRVPYFFLVQGQQFEMSGNSIYVHILGGVPTLYVATSPDGSRIYKLGGFPLAEEEFNCLVSDGPPQSIRGEDNATGRGLLCAELVYGLSPTWWISDSFSVRLQAAHHFYDEGHKNGLALADKWWRSFKGDKTALKISTTKSNEEFSVSLPVFWATVEGSISAEIRLYSIKVSDTGTCHADFQVFYKFPRKEGGS
jgi:hypothetical protein